MTWFDLATGNLLRRGVVGHVLPGAAPLTVVTEAGIRRIAGAALAIQFEKFSDGRGFTAARHVREVLGFTGPLVAQGHVIPDQADYLRRCGFTHAEINRRATKRPGLKVSLKIDATVSGHGFGPIFREGARFRPVAFRLPLLPLRRIPPI